MKFDEFKNINDKEWLRLTGIKQDIFNKMLDILQVAFFAPVNRNNSLSLIKLNLSNFIILISYNFYFNLKIFYRNFKIIILGYARSLFIMR
ncbi:MAG: hypothetical protein OHM56_00460 [Spiroplasma phoeniceum]|nr:MAG: hypothetical protein OHM57_12975 [Spiroplasma phoeniceum]UZQ32495.1 MAG: hypothetical protein OHM56_00460 [Spiroplasma phoeniceum]